MDTCDVAIIGGGVVGASVAFHLTRLGCRRVVVLERGQVAGGATARSSGIVRTHYSVPINVRVARASLGMFERFQELLDDEEAACGLVKSGYLIVAPPGATSDAVRQSVAMQAGHGVAARMLDAQQARELHPWLDVADVDAMGYEAEAGFADPYLTTQSFIRAARRGGAVVRQGTEVTGLLREGDRITGVQTADGTLQAGCVLSAMNVWSRAAACWAGIAIPLGISRHQVFSLQADRSYTPDLPVLKDLVSRARLYMRPSSGALMVGAGDEGHAADDPEVDDIDPDMDELLDQAAQVARRLPAFVDARLARTWSGLYDTTPDWNPVLGAVPGVRGLQLAFGFSGHGFKLSPMIGRMLAQSLLGLATDLPLHQYRITRFAEGEPLVGAYGAGAVS